MTGWKSIETAPADTPVLLWHPGSKYQDRGPVIGHITMMAGQPFPVFGCTIYNPGDATHWHRLPKQPA